MLFHRIPHGFGLWDAAHALMVCVEELLERHCFNPSDEDTWAARQNARKLKSQRLMEESTGSTNNCVVNTIVEDNCDGLRVIELGAGAAPLPSLRVAKQLEALQQRSVVVATDYIDSLVNRCCKNVALNVSAEQSCCDFHVRNLRWGDETAVNEIMKIGSTEEKLFPWEESSVRPQPFDVILGADIVTCNSSSDYCMGDLAKSINDLSKESTLLVLAVNRRIVETEKKFMEALCKTESADDECHWDLIEKVEDDIEARWENFGKVAHNTSRPEMIQTWVLRRR